MLVDLHMLQNFPPSCLNRDDTNAPKTCEFGGKRRARISSQCQKRAIRQHTLFRETLGIGDRTKLLLKVLIENLVKKGRDAEKASQATTAFFKHAGIGVTDDGRTNVLLHLGREEIARMAERIDDHWEELLPGKAKKPEKKKGMLKQLGDGIVDGSYAADIAMFGRMIAERKNFNVVAACQVAHAISTNVISPEMDFYTAVDDLQPDEETGAGMMGVTEFTSACYYRYATIDLRTLLKNCGGDREMADRTVEAFLRTAVVALPSGKQATFAAHNPPYLIFMVVRGRGQPISLANAFASGIRAREDSEQSLPDESARALGRHWSDLTRMYGTDDLVSAKLCCLGALEAPLSDMALDTVEELITETMKRVRALDVPNEEVR